MSLSSDWQTLNSQSAHAYETHHSFGGHFYLTVQKHFLWWALVYWRGQNDHIIREKSIPKFWALLHFCQTLHKWVNQSLFLLQVKYTHNLFCDITTNVKRREWGIVLGFEPSAPWIVVVNHVWRGLDLSRVKPAATGHTYNSVNAERILLLCAVLGRRTIPLSILYQRLLHRSGNSHTDALKKANQQ